MNLNMNLMNFSNGNKVNSFSVSYNDHTKHALLWSNIFLRIDQEIKTIHKIELSNILKHAKDKKELLLFEET